MRKGGKINRCMESCGSQFDTLIPLTFDGPGFSVRVKFAFLCSFFTHTHWHTLCSSECYPSIHLNLASEVPAPAEQRRSLWSFALHTCVAWSARSLSTFLSCTSSYLSLGVEVAFCSGSTLAHYKVSLLDFTWLSSCSKRTGNNTVKPQVVDTSEIRVNRASNKASTICCMK